MPYRFPSYSTGILMQVRSLSSSSRATSWLRKMRVFLDVADPSRCTSCKASSALQGIDSMSRGRFPDISFAMGRILCGASSPVLSCTRGIVVTIFDGQLAPLLVRCGTGTRHMRTWSVVVSHSARFDCSWSRKMQRKSPRNVESLTVLLEYRTRRFRGAFASQSAEHTRPRHLISDQKASALNLTY